MATTNNDGAKNAWDEKELGCMWRREKQSNKEKYLTGVLKADKLREILAKSSEDIQLICFSNKGKQKDTHPDLRIYLSEKRQLNTTASAPRAARTTPSSAPVATAPPPDANELI